MLQLHVPRKGQLFLENLAKNSPDERNWKARLKKNGKARSLQSTYSTFYQSITQIYNTLIYGILSN